MSEYVNLTRTELTIINEQGEETILPISGNQCTIHKQVRSFHVDGKVPITEVGYEMTGVPQPEEGKLWVVSWKALMTMMALGYDVSDMCAPDNFIKDKNGRVTGARTLSRVV